MAASTWVASNSIVLDTMGASVESLDMYQDELDNMASGFQRSVAVYSNRSGAMSCARCHEAFQLTEKIVKSDGVSWHAHCFVADTADQQNAPICAKCLEVIDEKTESRVNFGNQFWHTSCFVCAQCFRPFQDGKFYEFDGRKYCEDDFSVLFKPCCAKCGEFIVGRVIRAMQVSWHPMCFKCQLCNKVLEDAFVKNLGRALCRTCNTSERATSAGRALCAKCHAIIEEGEMLHYRSEPYHPYHFQCHSCQAELTADARQIGDELYCLRCNDKMGVPICGACRRPIEERVVHALGKTWHVEHFVCAKCEKPFLGSRHYEKKGLAYCDTHYQQLFGLTCHSCSRVVAEECVIALNKAWCVEHFACAFCDRKLSQKSKFWECDLRPVCKSCYERFPSEFRKRLAKQHKLENK